MATFKSSSNTTGDMGQVNFIPIFSPEYGKEADLIEVGGVFIIRVMVVHLDN